MGATGCSSAKGQLLSEFSVKKNILFACDDGCCFLSWAGSGLVPAGAITSPPCLSSVCGNGDLLVTESPLWLPTRQTGWDQIFLVMILGHLCSWNLQVGSHMPWRGDGKSSEWGGMMVHCWDGAGWELLFSSIRLVNIKLELLNPFLRRRLTCFSMLEIMKFGVLLAQWHVHTARSEGKSRHASSLTINCNESNKIHLDAKQTLFKLFSEVFCIYYGWYN